MAPTDKKKNLQLTDPETDTCRETEVGYNEVGNRRSEDSNLKGD